MHLNSQLNVDCESKTRRPLLYWGQ